MLLTTSSPFFSRRSQSPCPIGSCSGPHRPVFFSSNLELFDNDHSSPSASPSSPDSNSTWIDDQLEQARLRRSPFYRRLQSSSRARLNHEDLALHKSGKNQETRPSDVGGGGGGVGVESGFEPHTSWRFYTSYDNGEWRRHAAPIPKVKDDDPGFKVNGLTGFQRRGVEHVRGGGGDDVIVSGCQAAESSLRRTRQSRTTAAELLQQRRTTTMMTMGGSGCRGNNSSGGGSGLSGYRTLSCSMESFRGIASDAKCHQDSIGNFTRGAIMRDRRSLSPRNQPSVTVDDVIASNGAVIRDGEVIRDDFQPNRKFALTGSVKINGIEAKLEDKIIVPTKYKNTATGKPEVKITGTSGGRIGAETANRKSITEATKVKGQSAATCMTGLGEMKSRIQQVSTGGGDDDRHRISENLTSTNKEQNKIWRLTDAKRSDATRMRQEQRENDSQGGSKNSLLEKENDTENNHENDDQLKAGCTPGSSNQPPPPGSAGGGTEEPVKTSHETLTVNNDGITVIDASKGIDSLSGANNHVTPSRFHLDRTEDEAEKQQEKETNTKGVTKTIIPLENSPTSDEKIVKFVSVCFINVGSGQNTANTKNGTLGTAGTSKLKVISGTESKKSTTALNQTNSEDDLEDWIVEMAVRD